MTKIEKKEKELQSVQKKLDESRIKTKELEEKERELKTQVNLLRFEEMAEFMTDHQISDFEEMKRYALRGKGSEVREDVSAD